MNTGTMLGNNQSGRRLYLLVTFGLIFGYTLADMASTTSAYQQQQDRTLVYVFLILILIDLGVYTLAALLKRQLRLPLMASMAAITCWVILDNIIIGYDLWSALTHIGLTVWWIFAYAFAYLYITAHEDSRRLFLGFFVFIFLYYSFQMVTVALRSWAAYGSDTVVLNLIYRLLVIVPALYLMKSAKLRNVCLLGVFILTFLSMKRGAILTFPLMVLGAILVQSRRRRDTLAAIGKLLIIVLLIAGLAAVFDRVSDGFLSSRFTWEQLKYGSSRDQIYSETARQIRNRDALGLLLGSGGGSSGGVHNETLEFLFSYGLIGLLLHMIFLLAVALRSLRLIRQRSEYAPAYAAAAIFILMVDVFSGFYFTHSTAYIMFFFGMAEALIHREREPAAISPPGGNDAADRRSPHDRI